MSRAIHTYVFESTTGNTALHAAKIPAGYRSKVIIKSSTVHGACLQFTRLFHFHPFSYCGRCEYVYFFITSIDGQWANIDSETR